MCVYNYNNNFVNLSQCKDDNNIESNSINKTQIIPSKQLRWWIKVPVQLYDKTRLWIKMLADSAADKPCANLHWAYKYFKKEICIDKFPVTLIIPNGQVKSKYCIYFTFPAVDGRIFKAKFVLLPDLPAPILADINMLVAFGYKFVDEIAPAFRSVPTYDHQLDF